MSMSDKQGISFMIISRPYIWLFLIVAVSFKVSKKQGHSPHFMQIS